MKNVSLKYFSIEDFFDKKAITNIEVFAPNYGHLEETMGHIFVIEGKLSGQLRGFVIPFYSTSVIFITEPPEFLTIPQKFFLYHELGHLTHFSWSIRKKPLMAFISIITVGLICLTLATIDSWLTVLAVPYLIHNLVILINKPKIIMDDELCADTFALKRIPKDLLNDLEKTLTSPRSIIFKTKKRAENMAEVLKARRSNNIFLEERFMFGSLIFQPLTMLLVMIGIFITDYQTVSWLAWSLIILIVVAVIGIVFLLKTHSQYQGIFFRELQKRIIFISEKARETKWPA